MSPVDQMPKANNLKGLRGFAARRPIILFISLALGLGWSLISYMDLANRGLVPGKAIPPPIFVLAANWIAVLGSAVFVTWAGEGFGAVKAMLARSVRWRIGLGWWLFVVFALPLATLGIGLAAGGSIKHVDLAPFLLKQTLSIGSAILLINIWEETGWSGFLQTRLERHHNIVVAALITSIPFAAIHVPLVFFAPVHPREILIALATLAGAAPLVRMLFATTLRGARDSVLAVGAIHALWNGSNSDSGLPGGLLTGVDMLSCCLTAVAALTLVIVVFNWRKMSKAFRAENYSVAATRRG